MSQQTDPQSPSDYDAGLGEQSSASDERGSGVLVWIAICLAGLLFVTTVGLLFKQWLLTNEPTSVIILEGDPTWDGAVATLTQLGDSSRKLTVTLQQQNYFTARFFVNHGTYTWAVTMDGKEKIHGATLVNKDNWAYRHALVGPAKAPEETAKAAAGGGRQTK